MSSSTTSDMDRDTWVRETVESTTLTRRQAAALYLRQTGVPRSEAADELGISPSNLDNAEREARQRIMKANNLLGLAGSIGAEPDELAPIGTCAECNEPTASLKVDPNDDGDLRERRMLCPECAPQGDDLP